MGGGMKESEPQLSAIERCMKSLKLGNALNMICPDCENEVEPANLKVGLCRNCHRNHLQEQAEQTRKLFKKTKL